MKFYILSVVSKKQAVAQIPFHLSENVLKTAQRNFYLGNNLKRFMMQYDAIYILHPVSSSLVNDHCFPASRMSGSELS